MFLMMILLESSKIQTMTRAITAEKEFCLENITTFKKLRDYERQRAETVVFGQLTSLFCEDAREEWL